MNPTMSPIAQLAQDAPALVEAFGEVALALNLSPRLIGNPDIEARLLQALEQTQGLNLTWELEITESEPIADFGRVTATLAQLRRKGVKIVLDDFGTGWSSWSRAELLNADRIKIDSVFVRQHQSPAAQSVQNFGHTAFHARALARSHDHHIQRHHVVHPLLAPDYRPSPAVGRTVFVGRLQLGSRGLQPKRHTGLLVGGPLCGSDS